MSAASSARPDGVSEKFWDPDKGEVRTEALIKSYRELERKLGGLAGRGVPETAEGYEIETEGELLTADPEVNEILHEAGFTQAQAQTVYSLAAERLLPMVNEMAAEFEAQNQIGRLEDHFGGKDKWLETSRQLGQWGKANFPDEVFSALSTTYEGVLALHNMMAKGEPGLIDGGQGGGGLSESGLREMMNDPRYWRDRDPAFAARVGSGFKALFPDK
ncbi:MAG TPA: hypothetical protein ENI55_02505 [Alphaproteobacteria bacterium]|nr:hypothetical protein [Alphaproteobacteria bacterium]